MNIDFKWNLNQVVDSIPRGTLGERAKRSFLYPHDSIWPEEDECFISLANQIYENLKPHHRRLFLSATLASYLLNPNQAPQIFLNWFQGKTTIIDLMDLDKSLEEFSSWRWGRAAIPLADPLEGWRDRIVYALVGCAKETSSELFPKWVHNCLNSDAQESVVLSAKLASSKHPGSNFFFWPMLDPSNPACTINGKSIALPVYLSFLSLASGNDIPMVLATGALGKNGSLHEVTYLEEKLGLAHKKGFSTVIYPLLEGVKPLDCSKETIPKGVSTLEEAEIAWSGENIIQIRFPPYLNDEGINDIPTNHEYQIKIPQLPQLVPDQEAALTSFIDFMQKTAPCFIMRGSAGTGKTTIIRYITHHLQNIGRTFMLLAPTGRAARMLSIKSFHSASTVHSAIYQFDKLDPHENSQVDLSDRRSDSDITFHFKLNSNQSLNTVFIVDEASMVSDNISEQEGLRFGSGRLLKDFIDFSNLKKLDSNAKIVFIGDHCQLLPVDGTEDGTPPALDGKYLNKKHNLNCCVVSLSQVIRQSDDSAILNKATKLRQQIEEGVFNRLDLSDYGEQIVSISHLAAVKKATNSALRGDWLPIIVYTNKQATVFNNEIRGQLWGDLKATPRHGDYLVVIKNSAKYRLVNGDNIKIIAVSLKGEARTINLKGKDPVQLNFRQLQVAQMLPSGDELKLDVFVIENPLYSESRSLTKEENQALYVDFKMRHQKMRPGTEDFALALRDDPYFNALQVKYGYAMTCHKAQGAEWDSVIVDFNDNRGKNNSEYFRFVYTAMTRAKQNLFTIDAPNFNEYTGMKWLKIQPSIESLQDSPEATKIQLTDPDFLRFSFSETKLFLFDNFARLRKAFREANIDIIDVKHSNYCEVIVVKHEMSLGTFQYNYKASGIASNVNLATNHGDSELAGKVVGIAKTVLSHKITELSEQEDFKKEHERRIRDAIRNSNVELISITSFPYRERYEFKHLGRKVEIDFIYNKKQQWTNELMASGDKNSGTEILKQLETAFVGGGE